MQGEKCLSMEEIAAMGEAIAETAAIIDVATHRFLTQLREFDRVDGWHRAGALSCAHWLSWRVGMNLGAAREKARVAKKLVELPLIDQALAKGEISYSKVRAITRVATAGNEGDLLTMARCATGAQLEKICRLKRRVNALEGPSDDPVEGRRYVVERPTDDGMVSIQLRLLPEEAARVMKALEVMGSGNRADGAVALAEAALAGKLPGEAENLRPPVHGDVAPAPLRRGGRADAGGRAGTGDRCRAEEPHHPGGAPARAIGPGWRLPVPRLHQSPLHRRSPHRALDRRRRDQSRQHGAPLPAAPPGAPRVRPLARAGRR
jgi:hypothetical protein